MSVNLKALLALFPSAAPKNHLDNDNDNDNDDGTIRGACPFDVFKENFTLKFVDIIEHIRGNEMQGKLFDGDLSRFDGDHSKADLGLCHEFAKHGLDGPQIDVAMRSSGLYREKWERDDYRSNTIQKALNSSKDRVQQPSEKRLHLINGRIDITRDPPPARDWVVKDILLTGKSAVLAGFGGVSKTQLAIQICFDIVLGRSFAGHLTKQGRAMILLGEEDRDEVERRVSALVRYHEISDAEMDTLRANIFGFPFVGIDMRLSQKIGWELKESDFPEEIVEAAREAGNVNLIVLDHLSLVHGGDFNAREDATLTMRLVNRIAQDTGAAVLVLAHSPKSSANSPESDASAVGGSAVFVDQARAVGILATMRSDEAKKYGIGDDLRKQYVSLTLVKMNYGPTDRTLWLQRMPFDDTAVLEFVELSPPPPQPKGDAKLESRILELVRENPGKYSRTRFREKYSGQKGTLGASKATVARVLDDMVEDQRVICRAPTEAERKTHRLGGQVREVLCLWGPTL